MDLVDYSQEVYERIHDEFTDVRDQAARSPTSTVIPISALKGDNVVTRSENMPWYDGPIAAAPPRERPRRLRPRPRRRPLPGAVRHPPEVRRVPRLPRLRRAGRRRRAEAGRRGRRAAQSGMTSHDRRASRPLDGEVDEAFPPMSVTVRLEDDVDVSPRRHDLPAEQRADRAQDIDAMICWMDDRAAAPRQKLAIKHTTRIGRALVKDIQYRLDVNTLHRDEEANELGAQRDRPRPAAHDRAAAVRPLLAATAPPAASSSSTRRPTSPSAPG